MFSLRGVFERCQSGMPVFVSLPSSRMNLPENYDFFDCLF